MGVMNGANIAKTGAMVTCLNNANSLSTGGNVAFDAFAQNLTVFGFLNAID